MDLKKTLLLVGLSSGLAHADVEGTVSASYSSEYVYRGVNFGDNLTTLNITASGEAAGLTWHAGLLHGNSELGESLEGLNGALGVLAGGSFGDITLEETRMTVGVSKSLTDSVSLNAGMIVTSYDIADQDRREIYVGVSAQVAGIDLSGTVFFNESSVYSGDAYYELSASHTMNLGEGLDATLAVTYGNWDEDPFSGLINDLVGADVLVPLDDVDFFSISAALTKDFGDGVSGTLNVTHTISDNEGLIQLTEDETVVGASVSLSF